jgi:hypothetical protein
MIAIVQRWGIFSLAIPTNLVSLLLTSSSYCYPQHAMIDIIRADRHIAECRAHITRQRLRIGRALQQGQDTDVAEDMLDAVQVSLRAFERHRELILDRLKEE